MNRAGLLEEAAREALRLLVMERADAELRSFGADGVPGMEELRAEYRDVVEGMLKEALAPLEPAAEEENEDGEELARAWAERAEARRAAADALAEIASAAVPEEPGGQEIRVPDDAILPEQPPAEPQKTCRRCDRTKPVSAFGKHAKSSDGRAHICSDCTRETARQAARKREERRRAAEQTKTPPSQFAPEPEKQASEEKPSPASRMVETLKVTKLPPARPAKGRNGAQASLCANGEDCVAYDRLGSPTKLASGNTDGRCFACQEARHRERYA